MTKRTINLICISIVLFFNLPAGAKQSFPGKLHRPQRMILQLQEAAQLIQRSQQTIEITEPILAAAYDLAKRSATGSYSYQQRELLDVQFQTLLSIIDPIIELSEWNGKCMLNSEEIVIEIRFGRKTLTFQGVDITLSGLNLEEVSLLPDTGTTDYFHPVMETFERMETAMRRIKEVAIQFTEYLNILSRYLPSIQPVYDKEVQLGLEIMEASKESAESVRVILNRALDLINQSINGPYSEQQRNILNNEFEQMLAECTSTATHVFYGMGIIDSIDVLTINVCDETLEFACFDLTTAGLGLDVPITILTPSEAEAAIPYITVALKSVEDAIAALEENINFLSGYLQTSK